MQRTGKLKAVAETDKARIDELLQIAEINERVPANPPETFWEGLQAIWTYASLFSIEANQCSTSLGRVDRYLYPLYARDIAEGRLNEQKAFELFGCFMIKCCEVVWYVTEATATYFAGYMPFINMCVGGVAADGSDGTNDLTYLIMDVVAKFKVYQPTLACRMHNTSPYKYVNKVVDIIRASLILPAEERSLLKEYSGMLIRLHITLFLSKVAWKRAQMSWMVTPICTKDPALFLPVCGRMRTVWLQSKKLFTKIRSLLWWECLRQWMLTGKATETFVRLLPMYQSMEMTKTMLI